MKPPSLKALTASVARRSKKADIVTGAVGGLNTREQIAMLRPIRERKPMNRHKRHALESSTLMARSCWSVRHSVSRRVKGLPSHAASRFRSDLDINASFDDGEQECSDERAQYSLKSVRRVSPSLISRVLRCQFLPCCSFSYTRFVDTESEQSIFNVNDIISAYLSFSHRTSYFLLFIVFSLFYFGFILAFAAFYFGFSLYYPECITSAGRFIGKGPGAKVFADVFQLSWTTFSTVGYGIIFPSTGANSDYPIPQTCITVGVVGSFEAFVGVLYAGFCTAVLFGKVIRSQSQAQVYFSDPLVVRFGKEELSPGDKKRQGNIPRGNIAAVESRDLETGETLASIEESVIVDAQGDDNVNIPCPSLEFRLVNRLHDIDDGEIVEARLDCVAILDSKLCQADTFDSIDPAPSHDSPQDGKEPPSSSDDLTQLMMEQHKALFHNPNSKKPRVLTKLSLDANEHPFFRRVWFGRHRLDENSPLLTQSARNKIKQNGGYWPSEWNHARGIRNNLHFRHLLVCLSGTSNANATSVYAQKVYDLVDVNVGYRFVPMNYHTPSGALKTDAYLLNAICEQRGGGGEPFL
eukprot:CCRYP_012084-RA/>CCRYP_012084-RA protein AED:0.07 eAED:0.07 QI:167/1/1/1/1/1/4/74/578